MSERPRLALASNIGFSRIYCHRCRSETLHRSQLCVHCGATASVYQRERPKWQYKDGLKIRRRRA